MTRYEKVLKGAATWGSYYRMNPDEFAKDYLHLNLKWFQNMLLTMMFWSETFVFIACRGLGKTYLSAVYCVIRCILYPGTVICIASGTRGQATNVLEKINLLLKPNSPELCAEINEKESKFNGTNAQIVFHNTSAIKVVTSSDSARGNRCNVLLLDEYRLISKDTIDTILSKFLTLRRMPKYSELSEKERAAEYDKEHNLILYLSSAYFKDHWSYTKCLDAFNAMVNGRRQFVCGFPYQLALKEGLIDRNRIEEDMADSNFNEIKWSMEMDALWYGSEEDAFFDFESVSKNRKIQYPMYPANLAVKLGNRPEIRVVPKQNGEIRILSADIALMSSRRNKNDATAIFINRMKPTKAGRYLSNIVYADTYEGMRTDDQALIIRKLFDEYQCDYLALDTAGLGIGTYDCLSRDMVDSDAGEIYPALSCCNNQEMAARCAVPGAAKVIWSIKASPQFNSDCACLLRDGFRSGRIRLLCNENDAERWLGEIKGYSSLSPSDRTQLQLPYINTTLLVDELTKLEHEECGGGKVRVYERYGMRKDRYSSLSYNYYVAIQIENKMNKRYGMQSDTSEMFVIKPPKHSGKAVTTNGKGKNFGWSQ